MCDKTDDTDNNDNDDNDNDNNDNDDNDNDNNNNYNDIDMNDNNSTDSILENGVALRYQGKRLIWPEYALIIGFWPKKFGHLAKISFFIE